MRLVISAPAICSREQEYVLDIVLKEWLGLAFSIRFEDRLDYRVCCDDSPGEIRLPATFFNAAAIAWLAPESLPRFPLVGWDTSSVVPETLLTNPSIPILFGEALFGQSDTPVASTSLLQLPVDIFGSVFFMLSRYEEAVVDVCDKHGRFPSHASAAVQGEFLERPLVDEYVELLFAAMVRLWPAISRKVVEPVVRVTCDVDSLHRLNCSTFATAKGLAADLLRHRSTGKAWTNLTARLRVRNGNLTHEEHWRNLFWMMEMAESRQHIMTFFFLVGRNSLLDANYEIDAPYVRRLLREIHARGHHIGLHASYTTYLNAAQTQREADKIRSVLKLEGIDEPHLWSRQHYLRWSTPKTAANLDAARIACDFSLSFADHAGFRCGTSRDFHMYDVFGRRKMRLLQTPLILMECSVIEPSYMGMGFTDESLAYMLHLKTISLRMGKQFTMLWHNSYFDSPEATRFFESLVDEQLHDRKAPAENVAITWQ